METDTIKDVCDLLSWEFRAEGKNHNIMVEKGTGYAYRIMKVFKEEQCTDKTESEQRRVELNKSLDFIKHVMVPLIGPGYLTPPKLIRLPDDFIHQVTNMMPPDGARDWRCMRRTMDPLFPYAIRMKDLCTLPTLLSDTTTGSPVISVEIKPSRALMCTPATVGDWDWDLDGLCKSCVLQDVRVRGYGRWKTTSYCPIDLFSGNPDRMRCAMKALIDSPQGRFKIFKSGNLVYSHNLSNLSEPLKDLFGDKITDDEAQTDAFCDLMLKILTHVPESEENSSSMQDTKAFNNALRLGSVMCRKSSYVPKTGMSGDEVAELPRGCVLHNVLRAQTLGNYNMKAAHDSYVKVKEHLDKYPQDRERFLLEGPYDNETWSFMFDDDTEEEPNLESVEFAAKQTKRFLASIVTHHLSIMVALQALPDSISKDDLLENVIEDNQGRKYRFLTEVVDVDLLPLEGLETGLQKWNYQLKCYRSLEADKNSDNGNTSLKI